jgi:ketosteroid isomerase-like protein
LIRAKRWVIVQRFMILKGLQMHPNAELIKTFYTVFQSRDADGMNACYRSDIIFSDPVFGTLRGPEVTSMWQMLCERGKDLKIEFGDIHADDHTGSAHWEAWYTFSKSRRRVHNVIEAKFVFQEGKITQHTDRFNLWRWSAMALGPLGIFLGWTPFIQAGIRKEARYGLNAFMQK